MGSFGQAQCHRQWRASLFALFCLFLNGNAEEVLKVADEEELNVVDGQDGTWQTSYARGAKSAGCTLTPALAAVQV